MGAAVRALCSKSTPVQCTSLKSNLGHLEAAAAAAGLASLIVGPLLAGVVAINAQLRGYVFIFVFIIILIPLILRLNVHLSSIVSSKPFQMPVEVLPRTGENNLDDRSSRLSSFGFSGTIAHGAFDIQKPVVVDKLITPLAISLYRARSIRQEFQAKHFGRVAVARRSCREVCNGIEAKSAMYCRERIFTLADYTCRSQTTFDLSGPSGTSSSKTTEFGSFVPFGSSEVFKSLTDIPPGSAVGIGLNCNGSDDKLRSVIYSEPTHAPFLRASKLNLPDGFHQPQSSLMLMTGESRLGSQNFSDQLQRISSVEAGARAVGKSVRSIELPLITESMKQGDIGGE